MLTVGRWGKEAPTGDFPTGSAVFRGLSFPACVTGHFLPAVSFLVLVCFLFLLDGCTAVGPDFVKPTAPVAKGWIEDGDPRVETTVADYSEWWTVFNDPVLNALVETACRQNLSVQAAGIRILQARAQLGIAVGQQYPQTQELKGGYSFDRTSKNAANTTGGGDLKNQSVNYNLNAAWELDFWGKYMRGVESADATLTASIADYDNALVSLLGTVASTYIQIRTYQERLQVARENIEIQDKALKLAESRYRNGAVTELDVQQSMSLLYDTQAQLPSLEMSLRQQEDALCILLGIPPRNLDGLLEGTKPIPESPVEVAVGIPAELLMRRPDVRSAELQAAAQCAQIGLAKADLFPRISLLGSFGFLSSDSLLTRTGGSSLNDVFSWKSFAMSAGPSIEWPILNYGRITNNVRLQDAKFQEALVNYRNTVLNAAKEVEDALVGFLATQDQVRLLDSSVQAAKRAAELSLFQYREGATDYTPVLDSQRTLMQQQEKLTQGRGAVPTNLIGLYKALGGGWQARLGKEFVSQENLEAMRTRTDWGDLLPPQELPKNLALPAPANVHQLPRKPDW